MSVERASAVGVRAPAKLDWGLVLILFVAGLLGVVASVPLLIEILPRMIPAEMKDEPLPLPVWAIFAVGIVQNGVLLGAMIVCGLWLGARIGMGAPELAAWRAGVPRPGLGRRLAAAALIGLAGGVGATVVDALVLLPRTGTELAEWMVSVPIWKRLLAGVFYGGIFEELVSRLFLVTLLAWALGKWWRGADGRPAPGAVWTAIVIASLIFAAGHLPLAAHVGVLTPWLFVRVMVLNGVLGTVFGWLYVRRGLEAAIVAHGMTHFTLQGLMGVAVWWVGKG